MIDAAGAIYVLGGGGFTDTRYDDVWKSTDGGQDRTCAGYSRGYWVGTPRVLLGYSRGFFRGTVVAQGVPKGMFRGLRWLLKGTEEYIMDTLCGA